MLDIELPLLSIVIPTKNRQPTCLYAIESVLFLPKKDIEIIVQDCSDSNILEQQIIDKFGTDTRIKYEYVDSKPSMTDNWNRAYERATGLYKCGIGDDDAVLPNIYEITKWAKENNIEAVGHSKRYAYFWPDYTIVPEYASKLMIVDSINYEKVKIYNRNDLDNLLKVQATKPDMNYRNLPMAYHCLLSGALIEKLINKTGTFLDGTSLDVYSAFALGLLVNEFYIFDTPFTLPGSCGASNSNRAILKKINPHFLEFTKIDSDKRIPQVYNLTFTIVESTQKALSNLHDEKYSKLLDLPYLYADAFSYSFNIKMMKDLYGLMKENNFTKQQYFRFIKLYVCNQISACNTLLKSLIKRILINFGPLKSTIIKRNFKNLVLYKAANIFEAVDTIRTKNIPL
jgi:glycosyltransferase involved in cell wall biosynthesis